MASGDGWRSVSIAELEEVPWLGTGPTWRPLRAALGTRIVGMSAYTARRAGEEVIETHAEDGGEGRGHEEVYAVLAGVALFTLDGERLELGPGELVRVSPQVRRGAQALEDGTIVLALGGPRVFEPSASEWIERTRERMRSDPHAARRILEELRAEQPGSLGVLIAEALLAQASGDRAAARAALDQALRRDPSLAEQLAADPDLGPALAAPAERLAPEETPALVPAERSQPGEAPQAGSPVLIRTARREDASALLELLSQLHDEPGPAEPRDGLRETLGRILTSRGRVLLIAERGGRALGTLDLLVVENLTRGGRPWAAIENFVVDRAHRRLGVGGALLDAAADIALEAGCFKLQLVSHQSRAAAHALYEQAGFDAPVRGFRRYL